MLKPEDRLHTQGLLLGELKLLFKTLIVNGSFFPSGYFARAFLGETHTHATLNLFSPVNYY